MEGRIMTFKSNYDMYDANNVNIKDLNNKLFCTFTSGEELDELVSELSTVYTIMYNKMFVLFVKSTNEYVVTYNVDQGNVNTIPENTILVHHKKETNTLYTINALNELIKKLNDGVVDMSYRVNWPHYRNSILLTQHNELKQLNTKVFKIIEL
jgi:DNA-directed RNA polymerase subunit L